VAGAEPAGAWCCRRGKHVRGAAECGRRVGDRFISLSIRSRGSHKAGCQRANFHAPFDTDAPLTTPVAINNNSKMVWFGQ
jgi:hypothetical protein